MHILLANMGIKRIHFADLLLSFKHTCQPQTLDKSCSIFHAQSCRLPLVLDRSNELGVNCETATHQLVEELDQGDETTE